MFSGAGPGSWTVGVSLNGCVWVCVLGICIVTLFGICIDCSCMSYVGHVVGSAVCGVSSLDDVRVSPAVHVWVGETLQLWAGTVRSALLCNMVKIYIGTCRSYRRCYGYIEECSQGAASCSTCPERLQHTVPLFWCVWTSGSACTPCKMSWVVWCALFTLMLSFRALRQA
jgi:hypothetical protein